MKLSEVPIGKRVAMVENMDGEEVRKMHFERREGIVKFTSNPAKPTAFVTAYHLRTTQGVPGKKPRYDGGEVKHEVEVDGRIEVQVVTNLDIWDDEKTKHSDFEIGTEFMCGNKKWRCTDIGTRTIIVICLSEYPDDPSWFNGPPYAVVESVFDEYDLPACEIIK